MHANYYPPSYIQENRLPFNLHGRSISPHSYSRQDSRSMSSSSACSSVESERSSKIQHIFVVLAVCHDNPDIQTQSQPRSRASAWLCRRSIGYEPYLWLCRLVGCDRQRCMPTKVIVAFMAMNSPEARAGIRHLYHYRRLTGRRGCSGSRVGRRDYGYEPGGSVQVFGVRLVRGLPRSWTRAAGPVEGKWQRRQNQQRMERRRKDEGRERDGESGSSRT